MITTSANPQAPTPETLDAPGAVPIPHPNMGMNAANLPVTSQVVLQLYSQCLPVPTALQLGIVDAMSNGAPRVRVFDRFAPLIPEPVRLNIADAIDQGLVRDRAYDLFAPLTVITANSDRHTSNIIVGGPSPRGMDFARRR